MAQAVRNLPAMQETRLPPLGSERSPEEGSGTLYSILAWRIPWTEEPSVLQSMRLQTVGHDWVTNTHIPFLSSVGKESTCNAGDLDSIPWSGRSHGEGVDYPHQYSWASLVAQLVKNLHAMQETWVQSLGWEDLLEKEKATHSSILAWRSPWGHKKLDWLSQQVSWQWLC